MNIVLMNRVNSFKVEYKSPLHGVLMEAANVPVEGYWSFNVPYVDRGSVKTAEKLCRQAIHDAGCFHSECVINPLADVVHCRLFCQHSDLQPLMWMLERDLVKRKDNGELFNLTFITKWADLALKLAGFEPLPKLKLYQVMDKRTGKLL